jgi:NAD(P)-dependent dehydrogenase (short-subunit alcohol dehydrogenase family)
LPGAGRYQHTTGGRIIPVPRIFITGSADGLGRATAGVLMGEGHDVVLHARSRERAAALSDLAADAAGVVIGDLSSAAETRDLAGQVNEIGRMDAVIHNAGVFLEPSRSATAEGHAKTLAVNTLAPYMLTALTGRPDRLIYLSSRLHRASAGPSGISTGPSGTGTPHGHTP